MNLLFDENLVKKYKSTSQKVRVMSEYWVSQNMFCPCCGYNNITKLNNNMPVADFYCAKCGEVFELKSKGKALGKKIADGAYHTAIERITSNSNPDLFILQYDNTKIKNFYIIPKYFFTPDIIEKRKPLSDTARRAGWIGCNILFSNIPEQGKIPIINNGILIDKEIIVNQYKITEHLRVNNINSRGWLFDILQCVNSIHKQIFSLDEIYMFENILYKKHPENNNIRAKIRQQLQYLRDKGYIEFLGNGLYKKTI